MAKLGSLEPFIKMHSLINSLQNSKVYIYGCENLWLTIDLLGKVAQGRSFDGEAKVANETERSMDNK